MVQVGVHRVRPPPKVHVVRKVDPFLFDEIPRRLELVQKVALLGVILPVLPEDSLVLGRPDGLLVRRLRHSADGEVVPRRGHPKPLRGTGELLLLGPLGQVCEIPEVLQVSVPDLVHHAKYPLVDPPGRHPQAVQCIVDLCHSLPLPTHGERRARGLVDALPPVVADAVNQMGLVSPTTLLQGVLKAIHPLSDIGGLRIIRRWTGLAKALHPGISLPQLFPLQLGPPDPHDKGLVRQVAAAMAVRPGHWGHDHRHIFWVQNREHLQVILNDFEHLVRADQELCLLLDADVLCAAPLNVLSPPEPLELERGMLRRGRAGP
mmetsp:Transcript_9699/g.33514  ORF Transcript_9699/g.33514 Transcript_9699/m.33514 type:complete len:319 (+) Transcript_9699:1267-2223(+)